jgi:hypothetical protein
VGRIVSEHLRGSDADNNREAIHFARTTGTPLNRSFDINWSLFGGTGIADDQRLARAQERLRHYCARRGFPLRWVWCREISDRGHGAPNTHILAHVPEGEEVAFDAALANAFEPEGGVNSERAIFAQPAHGPMGKWRYMSKGLRREDARARDINPEPQGTIEGKRSGMTQNLNRAARRRWETTSQGSSTNRTCGMSASASRAMPELSGGHHV